MPFFFFPVHDYCVEVYTGDKFGAGTDANVYLEICGDRGDTGQRHLHGTRTDGKMFERKMVRLGIFVCFITTVVLALDIFKKIIQMLFIGNILTEFFFFLNGVSGQEAY